MSRNAHMVDLLRPELSYEDQLRNLLCKQELTNGDLHMIIENAELVKLAALEASKQRFGK